MGVADWFRDFCSGIAVKNASDISRRYKALTRRLNTDYWSTTSQVSHSFYAGSYGRNTAIHGTSDVDMVFRLPVKLYHQYNAHKGNGQSALLQDVRASVLKTYSSTKIGADGQVIMIPFSDGTYFELVPAFLNENGSFTYPSSNDGGEWRTTNPKPEIEAIRSRNIDCNSNLVPLCRMARRWKQKSNVPMGGLLIDTLAYQFIKTWAYRDKSYFYYDYMCRDFFDFLANQDKSQEFWRAPGSGQWVYAGKGQFQYKALRAYNIACRAIAHEAAVPSQGWSAKQAWREIFGTAFPS